MKKLYTILLAASVAVSASAEALKAPVANATAEATTCNVLLNRARNAKAELSAPVARVAAAPAKAAPAKAAPATMAELLGIYDYQIVLYSTSGNRNLSSTMCIQAGESENEVKLVGLRYTDVTIIGTVDFAAGTITCAPQELLEVEAENPSVSEDIWLFTTNASGQEDRTKSIVIKINADGTLSTDDLFVYGVEDMPGYSYATFDLVSMAKSTTRDTIVTFKERDTDAEGVYLSTYTEYTDYANTELKEDYTYGGEDLGECVVLSNFIFADNANTIPVQIERDTKTVFIDNWVWFIYNYEGTNYPVGIYSLTGNTLDAIEGTYAGNTISWTCDWTAVAPNLGSFGQFRGCTLTLPFSLDDAAAGISDVTIDNENAPVEYFNLQGMRVNEPAAGQVVIRRQGTKVQKILVK